MTSHLLLTAALLVMGIAIAVPFWADHKMAQNAKEKAIAAATRAWQRHAAEAKALKLAYRKGATPLGIAA